jgi:hypothetical protein
MLSRTCAFLACLALVGASPAAAACRQADLAGAWDAYVAYDDFADASWTVCVLQIAPNGAVGPGSRCTDGHGEQSIISGRLALPSSCRARGQVVQRFGPQRVQSQIPQATLGKDKNLLVGIGVAATGGLFIFHAVKR